MDVAMTGEGLTLAFSGALILAFLVGYGAGWVSRYDSDRWKSIRRNAEELDRLNREERD